MDIETLLDGIGDDGLYCIECYTEGELRECLAIISQCGWHIRDITSDLFLGMNDFDDGPVECVTLWLYGYDHGVSYATTTYEDYVVWHRKEFGEDDEIPDEVFKYADLYIPTPEPGAVDSDGLDVFLSDMR